MLIPNLPVIVWDDRLLGPLVNIFVSCKLVGMYLIHIKPLFSFSLMKCLSTSTCLVLSYCTVLWAIIITNLLSRYKHMELSHFILDLRKFSLAIVIYIPLELLFDILILHSDFKCSLSHASKVGILTLVNAQELTEFSFSFECDPK